MNSRLAAILVADMFGYSQLMAADEKGTVERQKAHRRELIDPEIERNRGRIVKTTGDGLLAEFSNAHDAVNCAVEIQRSMPDRERDRDTPDRIRYRVGLHVGDVIFDQGDIFGDAVNVAARLEGLAEPGGVCISDTIYQLVQDRIHHGFRDLGSQRIKNITRPVRVWQWSPGAGEADLELAESSRSQRVQFCRSQDGVQIAYATVGNGPALFKAPNWLNHVEYDWQSPVWGPALNEFARTNTLVRFDQRGNGLSDWEVEDISEEMMIADMDAVIHAAGLDRFALLGISQGCGFSIRYAALNPERVRCLVMLGGYVRGGMQRDSKDSEKAFRAAEAMVDSGWGSPNPAYRQFFVSTFIPDATPSQQSSFDELQRVSATADNAGRIMNMNASMNVSELAKKIEVPALVLHCQGDRDVPLEEGRRMAALIPNARFVLLEGNNHVLIEGTPAFDTFFREVHDFLAQHNN